MQPENFQDPKLARWLQVRKDLVRLLAEAKETKRKISENTLKKIVFPIPAEYKKEL